MCPESLFCGRDWGGKENYLFNTAIFTYEFIIYLFNLYSGPSQASDSGWQANLEQLKTVSNKYMQEQRIL